MPFIMKTLVKQMLEGEITMDAFMPLFLENKELKTLYIDLINRRMLYFVCSL